MGIGCVILCHIHCSLLLETTIACILDMILKEITGAVRKCLSFLVEHLPRQDLNL